MTHLLSLRNLRHHIVLLVGSVIVTLALSAPVWAQTPSFGSFDAPNAGNNDGEGTRPAIRQERSGPGTFPVHPIHSRGSLTIVGSWSVPGTMAFSSNKASFETRAGRSPLFLYRSSTTNRPTQCGSTIEGPSPASTRMPAGSITASSTDRNQAAALPHVASGRFAKELFRQPVRILLCDAAPAASIAGPKGRGSWKD